jgi:RecA/RadA recombinase
LAFQHPDQVLRNVSVKQPKSTEELLQLLEGVEEDILHRTNEDAFPVRVLIVDSIAAPLNRDFGADLVPQRAATAFSIAQTLKRYAEQLHLAVIVINQAGVDGHSLGGNEEWKNDQTTVRAALGTSWHHCVSTRILVEQLYASGAGYMGVGEESQLRSLRVVKSNWMPYVSLHFEITPIGIVEVEHNEQHDRPNTDKITIGRVVVI